MAESPPSVRGTTARTFASRKDKQHKKPSSKTEFFYSERLAESVSLHFLRNFRESNKPALVSYHESRERYTADFEDPNSGA